MYVNDEKIEEQNVTHVNEKCMRKVPIQCDDVDRRYKSGAHVSKLNPYEIKQYEMREIYVVICNKKEEAII